MTAPDTIMAISLCQPWATLIAIGGTNKITREWAPKYRGRLAIHASLAFTLDQGRLLVTEPFRAVLNAAGYHIPAQLPRGAIVATCELYDVVATQEIVGTLSAQERAFGDYTPLRYAWLLRDVVKLDRPIRTSGRRSLWDVTSLMEAKE